MFHRFTKFYFEGAVKWKFRQVKTLFPLKYKSFHPFCVIYKDYRGFTTSSCGETYIGETIQNASIRGRKTMTLLTSQILLNTFQTIFIMYLTG